MDIREAPCRNENAKEGVLALYPLRKHTAEYAANDATNKESITDSFLGDLKGPETLSENMTISHEMNEGHPVGSPGIHV